MDVDIQGGDYFVENIPLGNEDLPHHLHTGAPPLRAQWDMREISILSNGTCNVVAFVF